MKLLYYSILLFTFCNAQQQQPTLDYYLPQNSYVQQKYPNPKSILNFELEKCWSHTSSTLYERSSKSV
jgi:hypothetical protein